MFKKISFLGYFQIYTPFVRLFHPAGLLLAAALPLIAPSGVFAKNYALVIGTNYQGDSPVSDLELCEDDARLIQIKLGQTGNFEKSDIVTLLGAEVTRSNLKGQIDSLAKKVKQGDQVFIFFAGHGAFFRDAKAKNGMRHYIVMTQRPHVGDDELSEWLNQIRTKNALVVIDACFSGGMAKKGENVRGAENIPIPEGADSVVLQDIGDIYFKDKVVIGSADEDETAIEMGPPVSHGVFTYHFARAMTEADLNKDGDVSAYEAFYRAKKETVATAARVKHKQTPQISGDAENYYFVKKSVSSGGAASSEGSASSAAPPKGGVPPKASVSASNVSEGGADGGAQAVSGQSDGAGGGVGNITIVTSILKRNTEDIRVSREGKKEDIRVVWRKDPLWGEAATIEIRDVPAGVHEFMVEAEGYAKIELRAGIESGSTVEEELLIVREGRGSVVGNVWVENFTTPFGGLKVFLDPVRIPEQTVSVTDANGVFIFRELLPGTYTIRIIGGMGYFTKPYNTEVVIEEGEVADLEVVLRKSIELNTK